MLKTHDTGDSFQRRSKTIIKKMTYVSFYNFFILFDLFLHFWNVLIFLNRLIFVHL